MAFSHPIVRASIGSIVFAMLGSAATLPADLEMYEWRCSIGGSFETGHIYRARLSSDVFDGFQSFPLDLRVVDRDGSSWPGLIWSRSDNSGVFPVRHTPLKRTDEASDPDFTVKEFQIEPDPDGKIPMHNRVIVQAGSGEQVRRVEVWGGADKDDLDLLGYGFLVEQKSPAPVRNRAIDYPDSQAPLVVVRVFADLRQPDSALEWRSTEIARAERDDADHEEVSLEQLEKPDNEKTTEGVATMYFDVGAKNRPLLYLMFESDAVEFAVPVMIYGRNNETNKWRWIADGGLHHLDGHENNRIALAKSGYRYLKIEFYHYAQSPPKIKNVAAASMPHYLVFEARSDVKPYLYFGAPRYDLNMANPLRRVDASLLPEDEEAELSRRHTNPMRVASSLSDYHNTLLRFGLGIVVLLGAIFIARVLRHRYF